MALDMYQAAYTAESRAAQLKNAQNRIENTARPACGAVGGKLVCGAYSFFIADVPDDESMAAVAMAVAAGVRPRQPRRQC